MTPADLAALYADETASVERLTDGDSGTPPKPPTAVQDPDDRHIVWVTRWVAATGETGLLYWNPRGGSLR